MTSLSIYIVFTDPSQPEPAQPEPVLPEPAQPDPMEIDENEEEKMHVLEPTSGSVLWVI